MPNITRHFIALLALFGMVQQMSAHIYDNRFFRILRVPYSRERLFCDPYCQEEQGHYGESRYRNDIFFLTANDAVDDDKSIGIPEVFGQYDQVVLDAAISEAKGCPRVLDRPPFTGEVIKWAMKGKLQGQGLSFTYDQKLTNWLSGGFSFSFLHMTNRDEFFVTQGPRPLELDQIRRNFNNKLGIVSTKWSHAGITDVETYLRLGNVWNYALKCRRIDAGMWFGAYWPAGISRDITNPASVPFGGNGHYGFYWGLNTEVELKEDIKAGGLFRIIKRFAQTKTARIPVNNEQQLWGAVIGPVRVNPGPTFVASPYVRIEEIRDGLGFMVNYTAIHHNDDSFEDKREQQIPRATFSLMREKSDWTAEYVSLFLFYDFTKVKVPGSFLPLISLSWDIPVSYFAGDNVVQTNHIALGIEFTF